MSVLLLFVIGVVGVHNIIGWLWWVDCGWCVNESVDVVVVVWLMCMVCFMFCDVMCVVVVCL